MKNINKYVALVVFGGMLTFNSAGDVVVVESDGTNLTGTSTAAKLDLDSGGEIVGPATLPKNRNT